MKLYEAAQDKELMESFKGYCISHLEELAIERAFNNESVVGIGDAKTIIDKVFDEIETRFSPKEPVKEPINESR